MNDNRLLKNSQRRFYAPPVEHDKQVYVCFGNRGSGHSAQFYYYLFKRAHDKERKKLMGELILIISITLILTVVSSFWLGYAYGKLRTIKSYETSQKQIFIDYMGQNLKGESTSEDD